MWHTYFNLSKGYFSILLSPCFIYIFIHNTFQTIFFMRNVITTTLRQQLTFGKCNCTYWRFSSKQSAVGNEQNTVSDWFLPRNSNLKFWETHTHTPHTHTHTHNVIKILQYLSTFIFQHEDLCLLHNIIDIVCRKRKYVNDSCFLIQIVQLQVFLPP